MDSDFRAYDEVSSVLMVLDITLCWFDDGFGFGISLSSVFEKRDIQIMYHQLKQTESFLTNSTDEYLLSFRLEIAEIAHEIRKYIVSKLEKLKKDEQATSRNAYHAFAAQSDIIHVLKRMLRTSNEEEHLFLYDAVVSLLHDLELILSSHRHTCYPEHQFRIGDIQIMYDNLSMMDSLLVDSSGHGYDKKLTNSLEHWVGLVAYRGRDYIDSWPWSLIEKQSTGSFPPSIYKFDDQLHKLTQSMEYVNRELIGLTEKRPTGSFPVSSQIFDDHLRKLNRSLEYINQELMGLTEKQPTGFLPPTSEHIFKLHGTTSTDGAAQVSCRNLHQITKFIEFINNRLKKICDGTDIIQTSTQSLQGTTSTGQCDYNNISGYIL